MTRVDRDLIIVHGAAPSSVTGVAPLPGLLVATRAPIRLIGLGLGLITGLPGSMSSQTPSVPHTPVVFAFRTDSAGLATLRARTADLVRRRRPLEVTVRALYRYDPATDSWARLADRLPGKILPVPEPRQVYSARTDPVVYTFPPVGLFWAIWEEDGDRHTSPALAGPVLCNDVMIGPAPGGRVAMCVPFADHAEARFVPDPAGLPE